MKHIRIYFIVVAATLLLHACSPAEGEFTGHEYMPDMAHSVAYEANTYNYYYYNTWDQVSTFTTKELTRAGEPVKGTVPRGYAGVYFAQNGTAQNAVMENLHGETTLNAISIPINGSVPYYYVDTPEDRERAKAEIIDNPFPITAKSLEQGKELYDLYCGICHGAKGDGMGYLVSEDNPNVKYPAQPANLINEDFSNSSNGRFYHAIVYGLNVMGSYSDKLSYEERWDVIHYIRSLQAKAAGATYSQDENTFNAAYGTPAGSETSAIAQGPMTDEMPAPGEGGTEEDHGGTEDHNGGH